MAGNNDLVAGKQHPHQHAQIAAGGTVDQEIAFIGLIGPGRQSLGLLDDPGGMEQAVGLGQDGQVHSEDRIAHQPAPGLIDPPALFVAGSVERHLGLLDVCGQGFEQRCPALGRIMGRWTVLHQCLSGLTVRRTWRSAGSYRLSPSAVYRNLYAGTSAGRTCLNG